MRKLLICCAVALCCLSLVFGQAQVRKRIATDAQAKIIEDHEFAGLEINLDDYAVPDVSVNPEQRQKRRQYRQDINKGWEIIAVTKGMVFLYNPKTIRTASPALLSVWTKEYIKNTPGSLEREIERRRKVGLRHEGYETFSHSASLRQFDCVEQKSRVTTYTDYDTKGNLIETVSSMTSEWIDVIPDSIGDDIMQAVCKVRRSK